MMKSVKEIISAKRPAEEEISRNTGEIQLNASFQEDRHSLATLGIPNIVAFLCTLKRGQQVIAEGRGMAILGKTSRWIAKSIQTAKNASLIDAVSKGTRILEALQPDNRPRENTIVGEVYQPSSLETEQKPSEKQVSYFKHLVTSLVEDESEREQWLGSISQMNRADIAEAISEFAHR